MNRLSLAAGLLIVTSLATGCHSRMGGGCRDGSCGLLGGGACSGGACGIGDTLDPSDTGPGGPLAGLHGAKHQGPQSHTGPAPGPAMGPAQPTYGYPYYTTRGPRDFLNPNPPSIGP